VNHWVNKDTEIYCSFAENAGNTGCQMMNTAFHYHRLNKIYKSFSVDSIEAAVAAVRTLNIKGFAITMPYKVDVLKYVDEMSNDVKQIGAANTVMNRDGVLSAYNTDAYAAKTYLDRYDNRKTLYIVGNGGYAKAVKSAAIEWKMPIRSISIESITRKNFNDIGDIRDSIIYNCTPIDIESSVNKSNDFINCLVTTNTGKELATLQASKQYRMYTGLEFPF